MSKTNSKTETHNVQQQVHAVGNGWDLIIDQAVKQLREHEALAARLRVSLEFFKERKASGETFPGEERLKERGLI